MSPAAIATTGPCTMAAIFIINTLPCCGPVCTRCVHCLAQSPSHHSDRIKYQVLSEMRPEEKRLSLLYLWKTSPASVAQSGLTAPNTPSSLPGNLDQPPTTSRGHSTKGGTWNPGSLPGAWPSSVEHHGTNRHSQKSGAALSSAGPGALSERRQTRY